jgi:hypothetical protein
LKEFIENAVSPATTLMLGGVYKNNNILSEQNTVDTSGKMKTLQLMLDYFTGISEKTLVFSYSTMMLDILEDFVKVRGWKFLRLDGGTNTKIRQNLVNKFNNDKGFQIFLISSRAGGLGLNLKAATKVIIFDMSWNPSVDMQAQDRAYRIGQAEHVSVYRLVAKGTIEEVVYMKQLYKQELQKLFMEGSTGPRNFESEDLKGIDRLLQYSETSIFQTLRDKYANEDITTHNNSSSNSSSSSSSSSSSNSNNNQLTELQIKLKNNRENRNKLNGISVNNKTIIREIEDAINNDDEIEDPDELVVRNELTLNGDRKSFNILGLLGINPNNTHRNDDMLKDIDGDNDEDDNNDRNNGRISNYNNFKNNYFSDKNTNNNKNESVAVKRMNLSSSSASSFKNNINNNKNNNNTTPINKSFFVDKKESSNKNSNSNDVNNNVNRNNNITNNSPSPSIGYRPSYMKKKLVTESVDESKN